MPAEMNELRKCPAWRILNYKYEVYVPRFVTLDPEFVKERGVTAYEAATPEEEVFRYTYVNRLMDFVENGAIPRFKERSKAKELCKDIEELLKQWERAVLESVDEVDPPLEYLARLEDLYRLIYQQARIAAAETILSGEIVATRFERYMHQRNNNMKVGKQAAISALPEKAPDAFALIEDAVTRRFGE